MTGIVDSLCVEQDEPDDRVMNSSLHLHHRITNMLKEFLPPLYQRRRDNLAWLLTGLHQAEHVHLSKIADCRRGSATLNSKTRQLRRFLANEAIDAQRFYRPMARSLIATAARRHDRLRVLIDILELPGQRQILMAALAYRRRALPLLWHVQRRKGVTTSDTQIAFMHRIEQLLPPGERPVIVADGEFHSVALMRYLASVGWGFRLRLHADTYVHLPDGSLCQLAELAPLRGERRYLQQVYVTKEHAYGPVSIAIYWAENEDKPWFIVTDEAEASYLTLRTYSRRMWIEQLFADLQGGGFHLHRSRIYQVDRLSRLLMALSLVYLWLFHAGVYVVKRGWRKLVDRTDRRDRSLVEIGRHWLRRRLTNEQPLKYGLIPYF